MLIIKDRDTFVAVEEKILEIASIIEENQYDILNNDALRIAIALYNNGYVKLQFNSNAKAVEALEKVKDYISDVTYVKEPDYTNIINYIDQLIKEYGVNND